MISQRTGIISVAVLAAILVAVFLHSVYGRGAGLARDADNANAPAKNAQASPSVDQNPFTAQQNQSDGTASGEAKSWAEDALSVFGRLLLAVLLSSILAFRPRQNVPLFRRSLFVSQTQILLSVVAAALMMIVGDNTARAFAIFAAVSLTRSYALCRAFEAIRVRPPVCCKED